jgi:hypothetical protein
VRHADWLAAAQRQIAQREYRASENGGGLQAPNRAHDLRTYFEKSGHPRARPHGRGQPRAAAALARGRRARRLARRGGPGTELVGDGGAWRSGGRAVEWFVNSEAGLEQGFTLESASCR